MLAGVAVFVAVYALLAVPRLGRWVRERAEAVAPPRLQAAARVLTGRPGIAATGAAILVLPGLVAPRAAFAAIDFRTLALLLGMMLLVGALEAANVFAVLASRLARAMPSPRRLLVGSMLLVAILSALVLNDAVVLLFTPVLVRAVRGMGAPVVPFLVAEALAANLGSAASPTGNPQNAAIALALDISFIEFVRVLAPVSLVALLAGIAFCLVAFRRDLVPREARAPPPAERVTNRALFSLAAGGVAVALVGFLAGPGAGVDLWAVAFGAGLLVLVLAPLAGGSPSRMLARVDWGILVLFVGLFVLLEAVRGERLLQRLVDTVAGSGSAGFVAATAVLSNVVSNVPAVLLLLPAVDGVGEALLLAAASTFAGNATFVGSAATIIVAETAKGEGEDFSVLRFTLVGLPLAVATLALAWLWLG